VRRKFYLPGSPAGKGAKWEWAGDSDDWHTYDMEVQCLIEEAWARVSKKTLTMRGLFYLRVLTKILLQGDKTIDVSKTYLGFPYIINFCNLTQVRCCTGYVRPIRRIQQAPYPLMKVALEELQITSGRRSATVTVKSSTVKVAHKKSSNSNTKKSNKKVSLVS